MQHKMHHILLIEDDPLASEALHQTLHQAGYQVTCVAHGQAALHWLADADAAPPSVVLLDLLTPVMNGWEFLQAFKRHAAYTRIPVLILAAFADRATTMGGGAISTLRRPLNTTALCTALGQLLAAPGATKIMH